jgi:hypothetical protein
MKTCILLFFAIGLSATAWTGCKSDETAPTPTPTSGIATVNSRVTNNTVSGFVFSRAANISYPNQAGVIPDVVAGVQSEPSGALDVYLVRPDTVLPSFRLLRSFVSADSAEQYFQGLGEIPDTTYLNLALPLRVGGIWAVKTRANTFAKILIKSSTAVIDSSTPGTHTLFGETTFAWAYQPDGSRRF